MARHLRQLGLTLIAISLVGSLAASAANALPAHFFAETNVAPFVTVPVVEDPFDPEQTFETNSITVECDFFNGTATASTTTSEVTPLEIEYWSDVWVEEGPCEANGLKAEIEFNGCEYTFNAGTWNGGGMATGSLDLRCPPEGAVRIDAGPKCEIFLPPQEGLTRVTYTNVEENPPTGEITVDIEISNLVYVGVGELCEEIGFKGVYEGGATMTAFEDIKDGPQVPFSVVPQ